MALALNIDLGELEDEPAELFAVATTVNIACGGHAGDATSIARSVARAAAAGALIAAHPSYPDREGFGRRAKFVDRPTTVESIRVQLRALRAAGDAASVRVRGLKLHGALYHDASTDRDLANDVVASAIALLPHLDHVTGPSGSAIEAAARAAHLRFAREGFADRRYLPDGALAPRSSPGALLTTAEACAAQAVTLAESGVFDSICCHGDTPGALEIARAVRAALSAHGALA